MSDKKEKTEEKKVLRKARVPKSEKKVAEPKQSGHTFTQNPLELLITIVIQENKIKEAMHTLDEKFKTIKDGKGVAFTVPLTSVIGTLIFRFLSNNRMTVKEEKQ